MLNDEKCTFSESLWFIACSSSFSASVRDIIIALRALCVLCNCCKNHFNNQLVIFKICSPDHTNKYTWHPFSDFWNDLSNPLYSALVLHHCEQNGTNHCQLSRSNWRFHYNFSVTFGMTSQTHYYYTKVMTDLFYELPEVKSTIVFTDHNRSSSSSSSSSY